MKAIEAMNAAMDEAHTDVMQLASNLQSSLFATREDIGEAYGELLSLIEELPKNKRGSVMAGVQVLVNTIAEEVKRKAEWR